MAERVAIALRELREHRRFKQALDRAEVHRITSHELRQIDGLVFDRASCDADGDVLYLARGESAEASDAAPTREGHGIRYDAEGRVIGVTIINAPMLLDRDGHLTITLPHEFHVDVSDLAGALS